MYPYGELFSRNYGIFSETQQERLRRAKVLIVGCGGIGGVVAIILARSGVGHFTLVEFDGYDATNMNRQIACFQETLGRNKADVIGDQIKRINPEAEVEIHNRLLNHAEIAQLIPKVDLVFPAADDFAFSICVFRDAKRLSKPALLVVPAGTWANVAIVPPRGPSVEDMQGVPKLPTYEALKKMLSIRRYKFGTYFYTLFGDWRIDYYRDFIEKDLPPTQICPSVWLCSALGALETVKFLTGKWKPVTLPRYWFITKNRISVNRINGLNMQAFLVRQRKLLWFIFQTRLGPGLESLQGIWWRVFYRAMKHRQERAR
ncbi:MAG: ThiF family adenylyltransferase [Smithellaceae bacterium]|nr:ThiF family adenylyltransferase [Smithellaceae bacterium]